VIRALYFGLAFVLLGVMNWYRVYRHGPAPLVVIAAVFCTAVGLVWIGLWWRRRQAP
jgi:hypothetical protein